VQGRDGGQDRGILNRFDGARLVEEPVPATLGERGAENVVDARVVAEIQRSPKTRQPKGDRDERDDDGIAPVRRDPASRSGVAHG
jgi:hypothetical protein